MTYLEGATQLADSLAERGMPADIAGIRREHVEAFLVELGPGQGNPDSWMAAGLGLAPGRVKPVASRSQR